MKSVGKPCEGKLHARFDEERLKVEWEFTNIIRIRNQSFTLSVRMVKLLSL